MWVYWERCIPRTEEWMMDNQQPNQPQYPSQTPQVPQTPQASQAYAPQAYAPQAYAPQAMPQQPVYAQPAPVQQPAVKPKKGWGKLFAALACLPLLIVGEIIGLYAGDATVLGEDLGAELGGALFAVVLCCILGGVSLLNITAKSWKWAWRGLWWSIAISAAIAILDLYDYISTDSLFPVRDWPWQFFLSIVYCIAIGFFEEFMARGLVLQGLLSRMGTNRKGVVWACILSSLFFGLLHVDLSRIFDVTALEFLQGLLKVLQTGMYGFALAAAVEYSVSGWMKVEFLVPVDEEEMRSSAEKEQRIEELMPSFPDKTQKPTSSALFDEPKEMTVRSTCGKWVYVMDGPGTVVTGLVPDGLKVTAYAKQDIFVLARSEDGSYGGWFGQGLLVPSGG